MKLGNILVIGLLFVLCGCGKSGNTIPETQENEELVAAEDLPQELQQDLPPHDVDTLPCGLRAAINNEANWDYDVKDIYESMELTDSLRERIRLFVQRESNFILAQLAYMDCYNPDYEIDIQKALNDEYILRPEDKKVLYDFLCKNTSLYNYAGTRYRMTRTTDGKWPF